MDKKKGQKKALGFIFGTAYIAGMIALVVFLNKQVDKGLVLPSVSNFFYDTFMITLGVILYALMPFRIIRDNKRIAITSYILVVALLVSAGCIKYLTIGNEVLSDILYLFSGAMLHQGIKCTIKFVKFKNCTQEVNN